MMSLFAFRLIFVGVSSLQLWTTISALQETKVGEESTYLEPLKVDHNRSSFETTSLSVSSLTVRSLSIAPPSNASLENTTVASVVRGENDLSVLQDALIAADFVDFLERAGPYTIFAPSNEAFSAVDEDGFVERLLSPEWKIHVRTLVKFHVSPGRSPLLGANITDGMLIATMGSFYAQGEGLIASVLPDLTVRLSGKSFSNSTVRQTDLIADNGVVHKVDKLFLPTPLSMDIFETALTFDGYLSTISGLLTQAGMEETLRTETLTIFCPTNAAFDMLFPDALNEILTDEARRDQVVSLHLVKGNWYKERLVDGLQLASLAGTMLNVTVGTGFFADHFVNEDAVLQATDLVASNGIVHIIDRVLLSAERDDSFADDPDEGLTVADVQCSVCKTGLHISMPDVLVEVPGGVVEGVTEASRALVDSVMRNNPERISSAMCTDLRDRYMDDCGCILSDGIADDIPPVEILEDDSCSVCKPGREMRHPLREVPVPPGIVFNDTSFVPCVVMDRALAANPGVVDAQLCSSLREFYKNTCKCCRKKEEEETSTSASTDEESGACTRRSAFALLGSVYRSLSCRLQTLV